MLKKVDVLKTVEKSLQDIRGKITEKLKEMQRSSRVQGSSRLRRWRNDLLEKSNDLECESKETLRRWRNHFKRSNSDLQC